MGLFGRVFGGEKEPQREKEKISLEPFYEAAMKYGIEGLKLEKYPDGKEALLQKVGEGWLGIGYEEGKNRLWFGLTCETEGSKENQRWNCNTYLEKDKEYKGIRIGEGGVIEKDHPIAVLFAEINRKLGKREEEERPEIYLTGEHVNWERSKEAKLILDVEENLRGNIPTETEVKVVITNFKAKWESKKWGDDEEQKLEI